MKKCKCGNPQYDFDCVCNWIKKHPGTNEYICEYCGMYSASIARCDKCELQPKKGENESNG